MSYNAVILNQPACSEGESNGDLLLFQGASS